MFGKVAVFDGPKYQHDTDLKLTSWFASSLISPYLKFQCIFEFQFLLAPEGRGLDVDTVIY
jgi:hypothetical protein